MPSIIVASGSTNIASGSDDGLTKSITVGASESGGGLEPELSPFTRHPRKPMSLGFFAILWIETRVQISHVSARRRE